MSKKFFDTSVFDKKENDENNFTNIEDFKINIKPVEKDDFRRGFVLFSEYGNERLNQEELKSFLESMKNQNRLNRDEISFIEYLILKFSSSYTFYKVLNDVDIIFDGIFKSQFNFYFSDELIKIDDKEFNLQVELALSKTSEIEIKIDKISNIILGEHYIFVLDFSEKTFSKVSQKIPIGFLKQIILGKNSLRIEDYLQLEKSDILKELEKTTNLKYDSGLSKIRSLEKTSKTCDVILEIDNNNFFISAELKYRIGSETFNIRNYSYLENIDFGKDKCIKTIIEDGKLIEYLSDETLSEYTLEDLLFDIKVSYIDMDKNPFLLKVPVGQIEIFTKRVLPILEKEFEIVYKNENKLDFKKKQIEFLVDTNLRKSLNLFEFQVKFNLDGKELKIEDIKKLVDEQRETIKFDDGTSIKIENIKDINTWLEFLKKFNFKKSENKYVAKKEGALELDEFLKNFDNRNLKSNEEYKQIIKELKDRKPIEKIDLPKLKNFEFRDYQREGVYWLNFLHKYEFGGILADEMGLGKTLQALTLLEMHKDKLNLVVCPKSLIYNWEAEIKKYFSNLSVLLVNKTSEQREKLISKAKQYNIVVTSYSMLQKDYHIYDRHKVNFEYMILDEAHYVKNMKTQSNKATRVIDAKRKIVLTGTPLENNLEELYGTFDLVMPNYLGNHLEFKREYAYKIERGNKNALKILQAKIKPFILRRKKKDVLKELPQKQEQILFNEMSNRQVALYKEILNRTKKELLEIENRNEEGLGKSKIQVLSALLRLRQVCNHPYLIDKEFLDDSYSSKFEQFQQVLNEVIESEEKVLIFSQFTSMLDIMQKHLEEKKIKFVRLDGQTKNRGEVVDKFNNDDSIVVFLISLKAGGVGLNLTAASNVFIYDPWWNPQAENQAIDRAHRIGQKKNVNIYKFITKNSIEEKILKLQERKANLFDGIVNQEQDFVGKLEWEDLMELFEE